MFSIELLRCLLVCSNLREDVGGLLHLTPLSNLALARESVIGLLPELREAGRLLKLRLTRKSLCLF